jgi:tRNA A37 threonylcarbamoyladenosine biosynthesis protein TsaE
LVGGDHAHVQITRNVTAGAGTELLERSEDLSALGARLDSVSDSARGQLVLVRGEAGIGKTSLLRSFSEGLPRNVRLERSPRLRSS